MDHERPSPQLYYVPADNANRCGPNRTTRVLAITLAMAGLVSIAACDTGASGHTEAGSATSWGEPVDNADADSINYCGRSLEAPVLASFSITTKDNVDGLLAALRGSDMRGVFFMTPRTAKLFGGVVDKIRKDGHYVGIETEETLVTDTGTLRDPEIIEKNLSIPFGLANTSPPLVRPAEGAGLPFNGRTVNKSLGTAATMRDIQLCGWGWDAGWQDRPADDVIAGIRSGKTPLRRGLVMEFNGNNPGTAEVVTAVAKELRGGRIPYEHLSQPPPRAIHDIAKDANLTKIYHLPKGIRNNDPAYVMMCQRDAGDPAVFTFDDFGSRADVLDLLDVLDQINAQGIFFLVGDLAEKNPSIVAEIKRRGHIIGFHSMSHEHLLKSDGTTVSEEVINNELNLPPGLVNTDPPLYRPAYGDGLSFDISEDPISPLIAGIASKPRNAAPKGMQLCGWSWDSDDWRPDYTPEKIVKALDGDSYTDPMRPGYPMLWHIQSKNVLGALPLVAAELNRRGIAYQKLR